MSIQRFIRVTFTSLCLFVLIPMIVPTLAQDDVTYPIADIELPEFVAGFGIGFDVPEETEVEVFSQAGANYFALTFAYVDDDGAMIDARILVGSDSFVDVVTGTDADTDFATTFEAFTVAFNSTASEANQLDPEQFTSGTIGTNAVRSFTYTDTVQGYFLLMELADDGSMVAFDINSDELPAQTVEIVHAIANSVILTDEVTVEGADVASTTEEIIAELQATDVVVEDREAEFADADATYDEAGIRFDYPSGLGELDVSDLRDNNGPIIISSFEEETAFAEISIGSASYFSENTGIDVQVPLDEFFESLVAFGLQQEGFTITTRGVLDLGDEARPARYFEYTLPEVDRSGYLIIFEIDGVIYGIDSAKFDDETQPIVIEIIHTIATSLVLDDLTEDNDTGSTSSGTVGRSASSETTDTTDTGSQDLEDLGAPDIELVSTHAFPSGMTNGYPNGWDIMSKTDTVTILWYDNSPVFVQLYDLGALFGGTDLGFDFIKQTYGDGAATAWQDDNFDPVKSFDNVLINGNEAAVYTFVGQQDGTETTVWLYLINFGEGNYGMVQAYAIGEPPENYKLDVQAIAVSMRME